jgi:hypothetical protein
MFLSVSGVYVGRLSRGLFPAVGSRPAEGTYILSTGRSVLGVASTFLSVSVLIVFPPLVSGIFSESTPEPRGFVARSVFTGPLGEVFTVPVWRGP